MQLERRIILTASMTILLVVILLGGSSALTAYASANATANSTANASKSSTFGELDCNGQSLIQQAIRPGLGCTDIRGLSGITTANTWGGRFYDNGVYIGHDEPDLTFLSSKLGSGNDVTWSETLGSDPVAAPAVSKPGSDITHWFELSLAPWFSMALCNGESYPLLPCTPGSDLNAPTCVVCGPGQYPGAGSSFLEVQFYPPGFPPFYDSISCDTIHWCASLHINDLECTANFVNCNPSCEEPTNFAFIQTNGIPTGPPSPQDADVATFTPNSHTLLMNSGDKITVHIFDAPAPGGGKALEVFVDDLTTHQTGFMQASAANGYTATSIVNCAGTPFNYEPEYNTAAKNNIVPWAALQTDVSTEYETGHFEACTSVHNAIGTGGGGAKDLIYNKCSGPYETAAGSHADGGSLNAELGDAACFPKGDTHGTFKTPPGSIAGCLLDVFQNGDLDFDGSPYYADWPVSTTPTATLPGSFVQLYPITRGSPYSSFFFQTDVALSESSCTASALSGCTVPPQGPGHFYPYWSIVQLRPGGYSSCGIEFGNVAQGPGLNNFGKDAQYGQNLFNIIGYPEFEGPVQLAAC